MKICETFVNNQSLYYLTDKLNKKFFYPLLIVITFINNITGIFTYLYINFQISI